MKDQTAAFTGYRPFCFPFKDNENHPDCIELKKAIRQQIELLYTQGVKRFLSGASTGVDMWAGEIVIDLMKLYKDMELYCIIPYEDQAKEWTVSQKERYYDMLRDCTKLVQLSVQYYDDCYRIRNEFLVLHSKYLIAVYDTVKNTHSGTGQTVHMALKNGNAIICIHPQSWEISVIQLQQTDNK